MQVTRYILYLHRLSTVCKATIYKVPRLTIVCKAAIHKVAKLSAVCKAASSRLLGCFLLDVEDSYLKSIRAVHNSAEAVFIVRK
jgi:hypothetical protein